MRDEHPFYFGKELREPEPSPAMAQLLAVLGRFERHPQLMSTLSRHVQLRMIHRALYECPPDTLMLLAGYYETKAQDASPVYIPHVAEIEHLAYASNRAWLDLANLGFNVNDLHEPDIKGTSR